MQPDATLSWQDYRTDIGAAQVMGLAATANPLLASMQAHLLAAPTAYMADATEALPGLGASSMQQCEAGRDEATLPSQQARVTFSDQPQATPAQQLAATAPAVAAAAPSTTALPAQAAPSGAPGWQRKGKSKGGKAKSAPVSPAGSPRRSSRHGSQQQAQPLPRPPPPSSPPPPTTRRPPRAEAYMPTIDEAPAQQQQQPAARKPPPPQPPAFELPGRGALAATAARQDPAGFLEQLTNGFKGTMNMTQLAQLCANKQARDAIAQLALQAAPPAAATYAAALTAQPAAPRPASRVSYTTGGVSVLHSTASAAGPLPAGTPAQQPVVIISNMGTMPHIYALWYLHLLTQTVQGAGVWHKSRWQTAGLHCGELHRPRSQLVIC